MSSAMKQVFSLLLLVSFLVGCSNNLNGPVGKVSTDHKAYAKPNAIVYCGEISRLIHYSKSEKPMPKAVDLFGNNDTELYTVLYECAELGFIPTIDAKAEIIKDTKKALHNDEAKLLQDYSNNTWFALEGKSGRQFVGTNIFNITIYPISVFYLDYFPGRCADNEKNDALSDVIKIELNEPVKTGENAIVKWEVPSGLKVEDGCMNIIGAFSDNEQVVDIEEGAQGPSLIVAGMEVTNENKNKVTVACMMHLSEIYSVPPEVLLAISEVKGGKLGKEYGPLVDGSYELGIMKINLKAGI
jgi:hypothetical protein